MAKKSVKRTQTIISPRFFIPEGVDEFTYDEKSAAGVAVDISDDYWLATDDAIYGDSPLVPDILGIIEQIFRTSPYGTQVVDVVFDVEDVAGATNYEFRLVAL